MLTPLLELYPHALRRPFAAPWDVTMTHQNCSASVQIIASNGSGTYPFTIPKLILFAGVSM